MKKNIIVVFLILAFSSSLLLTACEKETPSGKPNSLFFFEYFNTVGAVYDYSYAPREQFDSNAQKIEEQVEKYHKLYDIYNNYSGINNIKTINDNAGKGKIYVPTEIIDLLEFSKDMYYKTDGRVNVAFGAVLKIWHKYRQEGERIPDKKELAEAAKHCDIENLIVCREEGYVELLDEGMSLDVGAVAKGFAVEKIAEFIKSEGLTSYAIDFGGNLRVVGTKLDGSGWRSAVQNPDTAGSNPYVAYLNISDSALVTSGVYERFYIVDGVRYHHIIDGETLFPETRYLSVTVNAPSSGVADALSTALFNAELEEAEKIINKFPGAGAIFVLPDGEIKLLGETSNVSFE